MNGFWRQNPRTKEWNWVWTSGPPSPTDIGKYGTDALYNQTTSPDGKPAGDRVAPQPDPPPPSGTDLPYDGYWARYRGGGGAWQWENAPSGHTGYNLDPNKLDPTKTPDGTPLFDENGNPINGGNPRYKGEKLPNGQPNPYYVPPNVDAPAMSVKPGWPRDITGDPLQDGGTPGPPPTGPPVHKAFAVHLADLRTAEETILTSVKSRITEYNAVLSQFAGDKHWIFTVNNGDVLHPYERGKVYNVDPNPQLTNEMGRIGDNLLLAVGDVLKAAGDFTLGIDTAAQLYAKADIESTMPEQ